MHYVGQLLGGPNNIVALNYQPRISRIADRNSHQSAVTFGKYRDITKQSVLYQKLMRSLSCLTSGIRNTL